MIFMTHDGFEIFTKKNHTKKDLAHCDAAK